MKKVLSLVLLTLVLCLSLSSVALAGDAEFRASMDACIVTPGEASIIYKGETYLPINMGKATLMGNWDYADVEFENSEDEDKYWHYDIYIYDGCDYALEVDYELRGSHAGTKYFVTESHIEELTHFANGESPGGYRTESYYGDTLTLSFEEVYDWIDSQNAEVLNSARIDNYSQYSLYSTDSGGFFGVESGMILRERMFTEQESNVYYLIYYPEYDRSYFYADGSIAKEEDIDLVAYRLNDNALESKITTLYDTLPEDDLDWLVEGEISDKTLAILSLVLFGIIPAAVIAVALIFILRKVSRPYRGCLIALCVCCAVIIACYAAVFILLT